MIALRCVTHKSSEDSSSVDFNYNWLAPPSKDKDAYDIKIGEEGQEKEEGKNERHGEEKDLLPMTETLLHLAHLKTHKYLLRYHVIFPYIFHLPFAGIQ